MQLVKIPNQLVNALQIRGEDTEVQNLKVPEFLHGDEVSIIEGPMAGYEGIFIAKTGKERVVILLDIAGQTARLNLNSDDLEAVG